MRKSLYYMKEVAERKAADVTKEVRNKQKLSVKQECSF